VPGTGIKDQILKQKILLASQLLRNYKGFRSSVLGTGEEKLNFYFLLQITITHGASNMAANFFYNAESWNHF
jgi:hypothetical protein